MQNIYDNPTDLEKLAKAQYSIPNLIMMENAARVMSNFILDLVQDKPQQHVLILCGKGNNGGDGYALARLLQDHVPVSIFCLEEAVSPDSISQAFICRQLKIPVYTEFPEHIEPTVIVDCLLGTGFYGELKPYLQNVLDKVNRMPGIKIACDVPTGMCFRADYTITMGALKMSLYTDQAKAVCGEIILANLGLSQKLYEEPDLSELVDSDTVPLLPLPCGYLLEESDMKLPYRTNPATHKGNYGHTVVFTRDKAGAGIMAGTAAMNFGSGLTTLIRTEQSNLDQFKISPGLMIANSIPVKTTCVILGPGFTTQDLVSQDSTVSQLLDWFTNVQNPSCVLDAGMFDFVELKSLLEELNRVPNARIVLTPHIKEYEKLIDKVPNINSLENVSVVKKSSNTIITSGGVTYVCSSGTQSLAKGGSGDILAGMIGALLAQGYSAKDACITGVLAHAKAGRENGAEDFSLTPETLLANIMKSLE